MNKQEYILQEQKLLRPYILDGAAGSLLSESNFEIDNELWASKLNFDKPEEVELIHRKYIDAGAQIITTNTFRTNPSALFRANLDIDQKIFVQTAVSIAKSAKLNGNILIAGSNAPAEDCYQKERRVSKTELENNHKSHIELLYESGADIIWNETQSHLDEIEIISSFCSTNEIPFSINLYCTDKLTLLSGEKLSEAIELAASYNPVSIGFNCVTREIIYRIFEEIKLPGRFGFYLNCYGGANKNNIDINEYIKIVKHSLRLNPLYIGSCCGSNPFYTKAIKELFDEIY